MNNVALPALRELTWQEARLTLAPLKPELTAIIDALSPPDDLLLYEMTYPFGSAILRDGGFYLPNKSHKLVPIQDSSISKSIRQALDYNQNSNPAGILLENTAELFMAFGNHIIPYALMAPGTLFGLWRIFDSSEHHPISLWQMTSGARSLFMLPKISNNALFAKMKKKYKLVTDAPQTILEQWNNFYELAEKTPLMWSSKILFFSKAWFDKMDNNSWLPLKCYLYQQLWEGSSFQRNNFLWNITLSRLLALKQYRFDPYIIDIIKHLFALGVGAAPGFAPATCDIAGPVQALQQIYIEDYQLKNYAPTFLQPAYLTKKTPEPIYYFLNHPTNLESSVLVRPNNLADIYHCWSLLTKCIQGFQVEKLNIEHTAIHTMLNEVQFDFYHIHAEDYSTIHDPSLIPKEDPRFISDKFTLNQGFPDKNPLFHGCIRLKYK